jgi:predicted DsbA family dithiol-disulfide isomerase
MKPAALPPSMTDTVTVYSDYVCPFCYLGKAPLEQYLADADEPPDVEWHQFDLRGYKRGRDGEIRDDVDDGKDETYFDRVRENVRRLREQYDVEMLDVDDRPVDVGSWDAQKLALHVQREFDEETFAALHERLFVALWQEGRDIGAVDVLVDVAADAGIDAEAVRDAVDDDDLDRALRDRFEAATQAGITGIPTFRSGEHAARGAVPPEQLERLVEGG